MPPRDPQAVLEKLGQTSLKVDAFFLRRTGFVANQTVLKLGEYNLHCVPATLGTAEARFLAVLTPAEIALFSKYKTGTHILLLTFDNADTTDIKRYPLRVGLTDMVPVPDRKNVCFLLLKFKSLPAEFVLFLGNYLEELEARQAAWEALSNQEFAYDAAAAKRTGIEPGLQLVSGEAKWPVELVSFHTKRLVLKGVPGSPQGPLHLKIKLHSHPLTLEGTLDEHGGFLAEFHGEWLDVVEEHVFQQRLQAKSGTVKDTAG